ncbi:MAG: recombinase family protein [Burkholderiales bacterium]|nr:recombinase family protein [Burkholderiales bacterium]
MTNFAYLRVSTDRQDAKNQKLGILDYCNSQNINNLKIVEDTISGTTSWRDRAIGTLIEGGITGDIIVVAEVSRLGRSILQVLEIMEIAAQKGISIHIAKNRMVMDGSMQSTITATVLGLVAQIEREFLSSRTKEALQQKKLEGIKLGRPKGQSDILKLDAFRDQISGYIKKGINKRAIAKLIECSPSTLYHWLKRRHIHTNKSNIV